MRLRVSEEQPAHLERFPIGASLEQALDGGLPVTRGAQVLNR
jgi:hypothetical protein